MNRTLYVNFANRSLTTVRARQPFAHVAEHEGISRSSIDRLHRVLWYNHGKRWLLACRDDRNLRFTYVENAEVNA